MNILQMMGLPTSPEAHPDPLKTPGGPAAQTTGEQGIDPAELDVEIQETLKSLETLSGGQTYYIFYRKRICSSTVDEVYDELRTIRNDCDRRFNVILFSGGGDIEAAFNLACLLRSIGHESLNIIVPRWAKSAATLIACAADTISMTPVAELGPLNPQIMDTPDSEDSRRLSCLSIIETFQLIRNEFRYGNEYFAAGLLERLQFPLALGSIVSSPKVSEEYLARTLRLQKAERSPEEVNAIAEKLVYGYADHRFCIRHDEAREIGLPVRLLEGEMHDLVWKIHRLSMRRMELSDRSGGVTWTTQV
jgi:hypothetical protein